MNEPLWTSAELVATCGAINAKPWYADGVQTDSREVLPGDLFIALSGETLNGHDFVRDAFSRGAVAAVVSEAVDGFDVSDTRLVHVADTMEALRLMAQHARFRAPTKTIAVTGSAGKTSIVQALRQALGRVDNTHSSIKSYNNHVGVPLSVARMPRQTRFGVFEVGMSGPGEIARSTKIVSPDVAIVSTIGAAHIAAFDGLLDIAKAKAEIFEGLSSEGTAIINIDTQHADVLMKAAAATGAKVVTVSANGPADVYPERKIEHHHCSCLTANVNGTLITYKVGQAGEEWLLNSLLVLAAIQAVGADLGHAALALASLQAEPGRGRVHQICAREGSVTLLDDSYNSNPLSLKAALRRLSLVPVGAGGRRIAVLADMRELGAQSDELHRNVGHDLTAFGVQKLFAVGEGMKAAGIEAGIETVACHNLDVLKEKLLRDLNDGDALMVKGANSARLETIVEGLLAASQRLNEDRLTDIAGGVNAV